MATTQSTIHPSRPRSTGLGLILPLAAVLAGNGCGDDGERHRPQLLDHSNVHFIEASRKYQIEFENESDADPVDTVWMADALSGSPLAYMMRPAIVIKVDDLGGPLNASTVRWIELADSYGAVVSLGIITSRLVERSDVNETYATLHARGFEAWFHGHSHDWSLPSAEFSGVSLDAQVASFETGIELGRNRLGVDFHSFGAPGNAMDDNTGKAVVAFPQIVVWLFGDGAAPGLADNDVLVLPRLMEFEESVGDVREPGFFSVSLNDLLDSTPTLEVLTLQVHPNRFNEEDHRRSRAIFDDLDRRGLFRYTSPYGWWKWMQDRETISLKKTGPTSYLLDLTSASFDHRIEFDPATALPASVDDAVP